MKTIIFGALLSGSLILSATAQQITDEINQDIIANTELENKVEQPTSVALPLLPQAPIEVFSPDFMADLRKCQPNYEVKDNSVVRILGMNNGRCRLSYANFELNIPLSLLGNIHSFDDLQTLLKNRDIASYTYKPDYIYDGLIYALDACHHKKGYDGESDELTDEYATIQRGIYSEFANDTCTINLYNRLDVDGAITDYSVICTVPYKTVSHLEEYVSDLIGQYGEKRGFAANGHIMVTLAQQNEQTHEADIALMYYLQQNGFCKKNNP